MSSPPRPLNGLSIASIVLAALFLHIIAIPLLACAADQYKAGTRCRGNPSFIATAWVNYGLYILTFGWAWIFPPAGVVFLIIFGWVSWTFMFLYSDEIRKAPLANNKAGITEFGPPQAQPSYTHRSETQAPYYVEPHHASPPPYAPQYVEPHHASSSPYAPQTTKEVSLRPDGSKVITTTVTTIDPEDGSEMVQKTVEVQPAPPKVEPGPIKTVPPSLRKSNIERLKEVQVRRDGSKVITSTVTTTFEDGSKEVEKTVETVESPSAPEEGKPAGEETTERGPTVQAADDQ